MNSCAHASGEQNRRSLATSVTLGHFSPSLTALLFTAMHRGALTVMKATTWSASATVSPLIGACVHLRVEAPPPSGFLVVPERSDGTCSVSDKRRRSTTVLALFYPCMRSGDLRMVSAATTSEVSCHRILARVRIWWPVA
jgi:hypothetical protein